MSGSTSIRSVRTISGSGPYAPVKEALAEHFVTWYIEQLVG